MKVSRSARADVEIAACVDFYTDNAPSDIALEFIGAVESTAQKIGEMPLSGSRRYEYLISGLRFMRVGKFPFLAFYVVERDHVRIVRVLHERRNIPDLLTH